MAKTMIVMTLVLIASVFSQAQAAAANAESTEKILTLTNSKYADSPADFFLVYNENKELTGLRYVAIGEGGKKDSRTISLKDLSSAEGVVVNQYEKYKVLTVRGSIDAKKGQGELTLRFLSNGMFMSFKECSLKMSRSAGENPSWSLLNPATKKVIKSANMVVGALGVSTIEGFCK